MAKRPTFAKLSADMVKRTVATPHKIIGPEGRWVMGWIVTDRKAA